MAYTPKSLLDLWTQQLDQAIAGQRDDDAKREFLDYAFNSSQQRYANFVAGLVRADPHPTYGWRPSATDFLLFIGEVSKRRDALMVPA